MCDTRTNNGLKSEIDFCREDDSIPLADGDPADFVEDSLVSEDKRKVGLVNIVFWFIMINKRNTKLTNSGFLGRNKLQPR